MQRIGGPRRKSRHKMLKPTRQKGKISITKYLQELNKGDKVVLKAEPGVQKGCYHARFHGLQGTVKSKVGRCYKVEIQDQNKTKVLLLHPVHLKKTK